jgi:hypothetical protein
LYSTSLIALSGVPEAMVAKGFCFQIERIARILAIRLTAAKLVTKVLSSPQKH